MEENYLSIFIESAFAKGESISFTSLIFLFFGRMLPIIALSPFLGAKVLPNPVKIALAFTLFIIFLPQLLLTITSPITFNPRLVLLVLKEVFVGLSIGTVISVPFIIVQTAGMIIDHQRGGASLMVNDPTIQNQSSPVGLFFNMVLIYIFYMVNGPFLFFDAIMQSYNLIPPDRFISPEFFGEDSPFWTLMIKLFNDVMVIGIQISSPALIAILMTDVFLGIANRLAPQVQITFLGMPLKSLLGMMVVCLGWNLMAKEFARQSIIWIQRVVEFTTLFKLSP